VLFVAFAAINGLLWDLAGSVACDDACGGDQYWGDPNAWQWTALKVLGVLGFLAALVYVALGRGERTSTARWFVYIVTLALMASPWVLHSTRSG
jgi:hypothetical protein